MSEMVERLARAIREEIVRQYRDDERGKCPAGAHFYEEKVSPHLIARAALQELRDNPTRDMQVSDELAFALDEQDPVRVFRAMLDKALEK